MPLVPFDGSTSKVSTCPMCGNTDYFILTDKQVANWHQRRAQTAKNKPKVSVFDIVKEYLGSHGYDGLCSTMDGDGCGCGINNLAPCGAIDEHCYAAFSVTKCDQHGALFYTDPDPPLRLG